MIMALMYLNPMSLKSLILHFEYAYAGSLIMISSQLI